MLTVTEIQRGLRSADRPPSCPIDDLPPAGSSRLAWVVPRPGIPRPTARPRPRLKTLPERYATGSFAKAKRGRAVRLMFQDEGRFGLLGTPCRCWSAKTAASVVGARLETQISLRLQRRQPARWRDGQPDPTVGECRDDVDLPG